MLKYGYAGRVLRIDLTRQNYTIQALDPAWIKPVIGGRPANTKRLKEELAIDCDPLGPDNLLIFGVGPLTGSLLPASAYYTVTAKSPLTGILGDSAAGGQFAAEMKQTGFDQIIISGQSKRLLYLLVREDGVQFIECPGLAGQTIVATTQAIRNQVGDHSLQVAAIGPAGENLVLFASIVSSGNRVNGRTGMGAVMGSKGIKALAVQGSRPLAVADPLFFMEECERISQAIRVHPDYQKRYQMGTTMLMSDLNSLGILPTKHFQEGVCDYVNQISGEKLSTAHKVKNKACFNCGLHCSRYTMTAHSEAEGPEYETLCCFTSRLGCSDLPFAVEMNATLNQMGLDSISTSEVIGWLMECQQRGLIQPADVDGLELRWGDTNAIRQAVEMIVHRKGLGDEMANGATRFSRRFSPEAQKLVMQVKGLDIICGDPRGIKAYGLTYAIASRGGDHLRAEPYFELSERHQEAKRRFGTEKAAMRMEEEGKAALVTWSEKIALLTDALTMCKNIGLCMDILDFQVVARLLRAGTGVKYTAAYVEKACADFAGLEYQLNQQFGVQPHQDTLPDRFRHQSLPKGPSAGATVNIETMVNEYRKLHNRD